MLRLWRQGFQGEFQWPGTSNFGAWLAVPAALRVWRALGEGRVRAHNHALLLEAVALLIKAFGTRDVLGAHPSLSLLSAMYDYSLACFGRWRCVCPIILLWWSP